MKVLIDMNLSPTWADEFNRVGLEAEHWMSIGDAAAPDEEIMDWANRHGWIVFTHDLDFGALLASTGAKGPSVIQLRSEDTRPATMAHFVLSCLKVFREDLERGALVTVDPRRMRATLLPLGTPSQDPA